MDLQFKLQLVEIFSLFMTTFQQVMLEAKKVDSQCYCQRPLVKEEECIQCSQCSFVAHLGCINNVTDWSCPRCNNDCVQMLEYLKAFYLQYQSQYCDLSGALGFLKYRLLGKKKITFEEERADLVTNFQEKTWLKRGITFDVSYAKALFRQVNCLQEIGDLYTGLKNSLVWVSGEQKLATLRAKALKGIKQIIKLEPANLLDEMIVQVIRMRINDQSSVTRESALDLLSQIFNSKTDVSAFVEIYLPMVVEREADRCQTVRKKVINILSQILEKHIREDVVKVLINKWQDSSQTVRQNLSKSLTSILKKKLVASRGILKTFSFLKQMISSFTTQQSNRGDIWQEVFSDKAARTLLIENGDQLSNLCIQDVLNNESKLESLRLLVILAPLTPRSVETNIQLIYPLLNAEQDSTCQQLLCELFIPVIEYVYREDGGDGLPIKTGEELRGAVKNLIYTCPLINIPHAIKLFESIDQLLLLQTICQCLNLLSKIIQEGIPPAKERIVGRSLLIVAQGIYLLPQSSLEKVGERLSINMKMQVSEIFDRVLSRKNGSPELLDLSLEALSFVWLAYPDLIEKTVTVNKKESSVFQLVLSSLQTKKLHSKTKGQILRTMSTFLSLQEQKQVSSCATLQTIEQQLQQFQDFCNHKDVLVRPAACELMTRMHEQGLITLTVSIEMFINFLVDPLPVVRQTGLINLTSLIRKRLGHFRACFNAKKVLQQSFEHQVQLNPFSVSAFIQLQSYDQSIVQEDKGFLESLLTQIGSEDSSLQYQFIMQMVNLAEDSEHLLTSRDPSYCLYYGHLLMTLGRNVPLDSQAFLKKVNNLLSTREQTVYAKLKKIVQEKDAQYSRDFMMKAFLESLLIYAVKLFQKLLLKVNQTKTQVQLNQLAKSVSKLYEIDLPRKNKPLDGCCEDLLVALKAEVKAKDQHLKMKLESQLQSITGEKMKRGRKTVALRQVSGGQDPEWEPTPKKRRATSRGASSNP